MSRLRLVHLIPLVLAIASLGAQHAKEPHGHTDAAKIKNPVRANAASIAAGQKVYAMHCAECHGDAGEGDGPMAAYTGDPQPSDLTDAMWQHGSSDGEIYTAIHDGIEGTGMRNYDKELTSEDIWHVVNYLRSIGPKPAKNH